MSTPKLTIQQAIQIRNDFSYLEGDVVQADGLELEINRILVGPYYNEKINSFWEAYHRDDFESRDDEELLAASFSPDAYCVYTLYQYHNGAYIRESVFETLDHLKIKMNLSKYKVKEK